MNRRKLFLWSLYDFANSIVFITFILYFAQWLVVDAAISGFWYNAIFAIATVLLLLSAPYLAARVDRRGGGKFFLNMATVGTALGYGAAVVAAYASMPFVAAAFFLVGQYFYQLSFVFYNPMIREVAEPSHRARASGIGQFANSLGQVAGLALALMIGGSRLDALIPAIVAFFILALPMMVFFKEEYVPDTEVAQRPAETPYLRAMLAFFMLSAATPMLVAYFFFNDALITLINNYSIVIERVFAVSDNTKSLLLMAIVVMSACGGVLAGWIADAKGPLRTLRWILLLWLVVLPTLALTKNFVLFAVVTACAGLLVGSVYGVSRAYVSMLLRPHEMTYGFSFFALSERFATFLGPLTWGSIILIYGENAFAYRLAVASMAVFVLIGAAVLFVYKPKKQDYVPEISH